jgi:hypothetical protein
MRSTSVGLSMTVVLCYAHPYRWTYTGEPLIRDTPFSRTRRQQRHGRACFRPRPKRFERLFYSPRPYRRQAALLVMDLRNALLDCDMVDLRV